MKAEAWPSSQYLMISRKHSAKGIRQEYRGQRPDPFIVRLPSWPSSSSSIGDNTYDM